MKLIKEDLKLDVIDDEFDRIHRIGNAIKDDGSGKTFNPINTGLLKGRFYRVVSSIFQ